jgi:hypothetical protein
MNLFICFSVSGGMGNSGSKSLTRCYMPTIRNNDMKFVLIDTLFKMAYCCKVHTGFLRHFLLAHPCSEPVVLYALR